MFTTISERSLVGRLWAQLTFTWGEARRDPAGLARSLVAADALDRRSRPMLWTIRLGVPAASSFGFFLGVLAYLLFVGVAPATTLPERRSHAVVPVFVPKDSPRPPAPDGGGGGGNREQMPVSKGQPPPSSLTDPIVPATTHPNPKAPDPLPVPPPIKAPPLPAPLPDRYGDPSSASPDTSDGPGSDGGAGTGTSGGWGPGIERGEGPGRTGGRGDGPDGPGGGQPPDESRPATKATILNAPRPEYTEAARTNKTQGTVKVRVLLGADGRVKQARVEAGLPDGLDERAIEAASRLRFRPATDRDGRAVDSWVTVSVNFTIR